MVEIVVIAAIGIIVGVGIVEVCEFIAEELR